MIKDILRNTFEKVIETNLDSQILDQIVYNNVLVVFQI